MKKIIKLEGLCCANCAAKIEEGVKKLDGVSSGQIRLRQTCETDMPLGGIRDKKKCLRKSRVDLATIATNDDFVVALMTLFKRRGQIKNLCIYEKKVYNITVVGSLFCIACIYGDCICPE